MALATHYRTARLALRPVAAADESDIVAAINDLDVSGWLSTVLYPYTEEDFRFFLSEIAKPGETFVIQDRLGGAGVVGLEDGELGYWLAPRAQGLGYATEACLALLAAHFATAGETFVAGYFEGNVRSARVLEKLGYIETGRRPRHCRALGTDRPHVDLLLTREAFLAST
ncbi:MAG: GNAT family N-acetyltransferase [Tabrizicola sp.]